MIDPNDGADDVRAAIIAFNLTGFRHSGARKDAASDDGADDVRAAIFAFNLPGFQRSAEPTESTIDPEIAKAIRAFGLQGFQSWSRFVRQAAKVDSPMRRTIHHEDAQTVHGRVQGESRA